MNDDPREELERSIQKASQLPGQEQWHVGWSSRDRVERPPPSPAKMLAWVGAFLGMFWDTSSSGTIIVGAGLGALAGYILGRLWMRFTKRRKPSV